MSRPQTTVTYLTRLDSVGQEVRVGDYVATTPVNATRLTVGRVTRISGNQSFEVVMDADNTFWKRLRRIAPWYRVVRVGEINKEIADRIDAAEAHYKMQFAVERQRLEERRRAYLAQRR